MVTAAVRIARANSRIEIVPAGFLGRPAFARYLEATRAAGARYDAQSRCQWLARADQVPAIADALRARDLTPIIDDSLRASLAAAADDVEATHLRTMERLGALGLRLRSYQEDGVRWLSGRRRALLGSDMGLGKTVQSLAALPGNGSAAVLVVCPAAVKGVWSREVSRWRPDYRTEILSGRGSFRWPSRGEVVVTNYDILPDDPESAPDGVYVIADEAHYLRRRSRTKGRDGQRRPSQRIRRWDALRTAADAAGGRLWLLTGTPLVGRPTDLWGVLSAGGLQREVFGSWRGLERAFRATRGRWGETTWGEPEPWVAEALARVMLRHERADVLGELPPVTIEHLGVSVGTRSLIDDEPDWDEIELSEDGGSVGAVGIPFERLSAARAELAAQKIPALDAQLDAIEDEQTGDPVIVFSAHRAPIDHLRSREGWAVITGDTPAAERTRIEEAFQRGEYRGLAGTIQAMGTGLTLTRAHLCLMVDRSWTPADNDQAIARLARMGQMRGVIARVLIADHPLDRRVAEILTRKSRLIETTVTAATERTGDRTGAEVDRLRSLAAEPAPAQQSERETEKTIDLGDLPPGRYALETADGGTSFWAIDRPKRGKWAGWTFARQQIGPSMDHRAMVRPDGTMRGHPATLAALRAILRDPEMAMRRYGIELGVCGACKLPLTNDESRRIGIGPICRKKMF